MKFFFSKTYFLLLQYCIFGNPVILSRISTQQGPGSKGTASNFSNRNEGGTSQYKLKPDDYGYDREYNGITEDTIL